MSLPSQTLRRTSLASNSSSTRQALTQQTRQASFLRRPQRPYTFTQLVTLSDGSSYVTRTTSPAPLYKSTKDTRNSIMWQPSMGSLRGIEEDEAGRLRAFRSRFGRGWDVEAKEEEEEETAARNAKKAGAEAEDVEQKPREEAMSLMDLISSEYKGEAPAKELDSVSVAKKHLKKAAKKK